jgi:curved DNA-binding protein CbpA
MKWFNNVNTLDELKAQYRKLAMKYHPDRGGDTATMQQINAEHDRLFEVLKRNHNRNADAQHQTTETAEEFRDIINALMKLGGLKIELCGSWLWISGATLQHKDKLKKAGCLWSANKKMWYWRHPENKRPHRGRSKSIEYIRAKYGSQVIDDDRKTA